MIDKMEDFSKIYDQASTQLSDQHLVSILICYLLYRLQMPMEPDHLYDVAVGTQIINYFYYADSIAFLLENESLKTDINAEGAEVYVLTAKGEECAKQLSRSVSKTYRERLMLAALQYNARRRHEKEVKVHYEEAEGACYVCIRWLGTGEHDFMQLRLFAPDREQAELLGEKIMCNPVRFYETFLDTILSNREEDYDLSDV